MKDMLDKIVDLYTDSGVKFTGYFIKPKDNIWFIGRIAIDDYRIIKDEKNKGFPLNGELNGKEINIPSAVFLGGESSIGNGNFLSVNILPFEILYGQKFEIAKIENFHFTIPELDNFFFRNVIKNDFFATYPTANIELEPEISKRLSTNSAKFQVTLVRSYQINNSQSYSSISSINRIIVTPQIYLNSKKIIEFVTCIRLFLSFILMEHVNLPSKIDIVLRDNRKDKYESTVLWVNDNKKIILNIRKNQLKFFLQMFMIHYRQYGRNG